MNSKTVQWLILAVAATVMILLVKLMLEMSGAVVEMTEHVGIMSRSVTELNGHVASLARDVKKMNVNVEHMNQTMQRMEGSIQGMGNAITRGSKEFQQWNPGGVMQQMMPDARTPAR